MRRVILGLSSFVIVAVSLFGTTTRAHGEIVIELIASPAPNVFGTSFPSSSYLDWFSNAQTAIRTGATSVGGGFSAFQDVTDDLRPVTEAIVTSFDSWNGFADPTIPPTGEFGQRMTFVYRIFDTTGALVELQNIKGIEIDNFFGTAGVAFSFTPGDGSGVAFDASTQFNNTTRVGFDSGGTLITSGNPAVSEIVGAFGSAFEPPGFLTGTNQEILREYMGIIGLGSDRLTHMIGKLSYMPDSSTTLSATAQVNFAPVPEPSTLALWGLGIVGLGLVSRSRRLKAREDPAIASSSS